MPPLLVDYINWSSASIRPPPEEMPPPEIMPAIPLSLLICLFVVENSSLNICDSPLLALLPWLDERLPSEALSSREDLC